jgi:integrase
LRREITDVFLRNLDPPKTGRLEVWDTREAGLVLRLTPSGMAVWSVRSRTQDGKRTRPKLGEWPKLGVADARKRARAMLVDIHRGADPVAEKQAARAERKARESMPTVGKRLLDWRQARSGDKAKPWSHRYAAEVKRLAEREIIPVIGKRPLIHTTRADWIELVAKKRQSAPAMASLLYRVISAFLGHAEASGWMPAPLLPRKGLVNLAPPPKARARTLTDGELKAIWAATDDLSTKARAFVRILILTAAREMEVADIAIGEVDLDAGMWSVPGSRTKNGCAVVLPLPTLLLAELQAVWPSRGAAGGPSWRLLGDIAGNGLRGFSKLKSRLDKASGVTGWRWHDLRRTARTGMTRLGVPREHAEAALNHISGRSALERTYDRHDFAPEVIVALGRWQAHVASLVIDAQSAYVIAIGGRGEPATAALTSQLTSTDC